MPDSRSAILRQIRTALGRGPLSDSAAAALDARRPAHTRLAFDEDLIERFVTRFESRSGTVARVSSLDALPAAVDAYRLAHGLPPRAAVARPLAGLPWPAGFAHHPGPAGPDEQMSVTPCLAGIAEIGSLMLASGPDSPTTLNFVPDHHLIVLPAGHIVRFKPGMFTNVLEKITLDRVECISRAENVRRNSIHTTCPELAGLYQLKGAITRQVKRINKEQKDANAAH